MFGEESQAFNKLEIDFFGDGVDGYQTWANIWVKRVQDVCTVNSFLKDDILAVLITF